MALKTNVYIDGFNLYYGCLRGSAHRWLDLGALCARLLPKNTINRIRYLSDCDIAVILSNDSDLVFPIEHVKQRLGKIIGIVNPHPRPSRELLGVANFYKSIRLSALAQCHFPDQMTDAQGEFHKPPTW